MGTFSVFSFQQMQLCHLYQDKSLYTHYAYMNAENIAVKFVQLIPYQNTLNSPYAVSSLLIFNI